jgi:hypothetical protein
MTVNYNRYDPRMPKSAASNLSHSSAAVSEGKETDEGTMMWPPEAKPNRSAVADPPEAQTLTPAMTKQALHILTRHPAVCIRTERAHPMLIDYLVFGD